MDQQTHIVSGVYTSRAEAEAVCDRLVEAGVLRELISIVDHAHAAGNSKMVDDDEALKDVLVDGAVGAAVGTGLGVVAEVALIAANVTLFVASPLIGPLAMLGWGASLVGVIGAVIGSESTDKKDGKFADLVQDAIMNGQVVLVVQTRSEDETAIAQEVIKEAVGDFKDAVAA